MLDYPEGFLGVALAALVAIGAPAIGMAYFAGGSSAYLADLGRTIENSQIAHGFGAIVRLVCRDGFMPFDYCGCTALGTSDEAATLRGLIAIVLLMVGAAAAVTGYFGFRHLYTLYSRNGKAWKRPRRGIHLFLSVVFFVAMIVIAEVMRAQLLNAVTEGNLDDCGRLPTNYELVAYVLSAFILVAELASLVVYIVGDVIEILFMRKS